MWGIWRFNISFFSKEREGDERVPPKFENNRRKRGETKTII
jgi:hypothetical protein